MDPVTKDTPGTKSQNKPPIGSKADQNQNTWLL